MSLFSHSVIGLELTPTAIRAVELELGRHLKLRATATVAIPEAEQKHAGKLDLITLVPRVKELLANAGGKRFTSRELYLSVPEEQVFRKILEVPPSVQENELLNVIRTEVASYLPNDIGTMELDYQVMPRTADNPEGPGFQVAVVAVSKELVNDYLALATSCKLKLRAVDTRPAALARAVVPSSESGEVLVVEWSEQGTIVAVVQRSLVWATGLAKATEDPAVAATSIIDELDHAIKFYANRTSSTSKISSIYLIAPETVRSSLHKALDSQLKGDYTLQLAKAVVPLEDMRYACALGSALYSVYQNTVK